MDPQRVVEMDGVSFAYGKHPVLNEISLSVFRGVIFGLLGANGAGKTTIIRLLVGLNRPHSGRVSVLGEGPSPRLGDRIGYMPQLSALYLELSPLENVDFFARMSGMSGRRERRDAIESVLRFVDLWDRRDDPVLKLSGGMRQRAMMAMALSCNPELIILDEPTTALDVLIQHEILEMLKDLNRRLDLTMLVISHDLAVVANLCQRVAVMYAGNIVEVAATAELLKNPLHPYTRGLLESFPRLEGHGRLNTIQGKVPDLSDPPAGCRFHPRCPSAMDRCRSEPPGLLELTPGHHVSCYLHEGNGAQTD